MCAGTRPTLADHSEIFESPAVRFIDTRARNEPTPRTNQHTRDDPSCVPREFRREATTDRAEKITIVLSTCDIFAQDRV